MKKNHYLIPCILFNTFTLLLSESATHPLFHAAREGKREVIREHLNNNANCAIKDNNGNTILHIAAEHGHAEIIEDLTQYRGWWQYYISGPTLPNIDEHNNNGYTPLETSINSGQYDAMIALMEAKKDKQKTELEQFEAFIAATRKNDPSSIYLLEQFGYNLLIQNTEGTILHNAIRQNKKQVIGYCARKAALINAKNKNNQAPIMLSVEKEDEDEIDFLAYLGADVNISGNNGMRPLHVAKTPRIVDCLLRNKAAIDAQDYDGHTPLHYNASQGNEEIVNHLINNKADIKKRNNKGEATFAIAIRSGHQKITKIIAEHPDSDINEQDINGQTSFIKAAQEKNLTWMKELIGYNVNRTLCDNAQENALHKLAKNGFIDGARIAIADNPSLLTAANKNGDIPIMTAAQNNQQKFLKFLIDCGSPLKTKNNKGETILHEAAKKKNSTLLIELLPYFSARDIDAQDFNGFTLIHHASAHDSIDNIKLAQKHGLLCSQQTKAGDTGAHIAAKNNSIHALRYFRESGEHFDVRNKNDETPFIAGALNGQLEATQYLLSEKHFINKEVAFLLNQFYYTHTSEQQKVYSFIKEKHEERLRECKRIYNEYTETINIINANKNSIVFLTEKNPLYFVTYLAYTPSSPHYEPVEHIYTKTKEQRTELLNHYLQCKNNELNRKITFEQHINAIRVEEERIKAARLAELELARKQEAERVAVEQQRIRVAQLKENQRKQEEQRARDQAQALQNNPPVVVQQNNAPVNDVVEEKAEDNENQVPQSGECFSCCNETTDKIPCKSVVPHSDFMCGPCLATWKAKNNSCPICRKAFDQ